MSMPPVSGQRVDLGSGAVAWWPCHIGKDASIGADCSIGALAHIGQRSVLGDGCRIQGSAYIADECVLGERVFVGPAAVLLNDKYPPSGDRNKWQPVRVGDCAVIGGNATLVPGSSMGRNSVLAAGAVLTSHLPDDEVWAGNPASLLMSRAAYEERREQS